MSLPSSYLHEIKALDREIINTCPNDILQFCANFFNRRLEAQRAALLLSNLPTSGSSNMAASSFPGRLGVGHNPFGVDMTTAPLAEIERQPSPTIRKQSTEEDENDTITSPTTAHYNKDKNGSGDGFGGDGHKEGPPNSSRFAYLCPQGGFPSNYGLGRRVSVSAESLNPTASSNDNWTPPYHSKTPEQLERLKISISGNFLFSHLDDEQSSQILGALVEKPIPGKGIKVIVQGDQGDFFYVVEKGSFDVYVNSAGSLQPGPDGMGVMVAKIGSGESFGELALMYNAPRAATVVSAETGCTLWALDRVTFRRILMDSTFERRRMYENFLEEVPLLSSLTAYERSKIADALKTHKFPAETVLIKEGDVGEAFYLLESGTAMVFKEGEPGPLAQYKKGDYFGELALLNDAPRAASVVSTSEVKVATLGKDGFQRLLGPVTTIMRRNDPRKESVSIDPLDPRKESVSIDPLEVK